MRRRVANISDFVDDPVSVIEFRARPLEALSEDCDEFETYHLSDSECQHVHRMKDEKYATWEWNFGSSPKFNILEAAGSQSVIWTCILM